MHFQVAVAAECDRLLQFQGRRCCLVVVLIFVTVREEFFFLFGSMAAIRKKESWGVESVSQCLYVFTRKRGVANVTFVV